MIARQPRFVIAVICGVVSYLLMNFLMTAAPLAMQMCGLSQESANLGLQWHVIAMYAPSFFTGRLITRFGAARIVTAGLTLIAAAAVTGLFGVDVAHFWATLILLGVGWNFGFIGASTMVLDTHRPEEKARGQLGGRPAGGAAALAHQGLGHGAAGQPVGLALVFVYQPDHRRAGQHPAGPTMVRQLRSRLGAHQPVRRHGEAGAALFISGGTRVLSVNYRDGGTMSGTMSGTIFGATWRFQAKQDAPATSPHDRPARRRRSERRKVRNKPDPARI